MALPLIDLSEERSRQVIVDREADRYLGQPDTVLLADGQTILMAYPRGHGGPDTLLKRSEDGGRTWSDRLPVPESFQGEHNAPSIHRVSDPQGVERLVLFVSSPAMKVAISEDLGKTWTPLRLLFEEALEGTPGYKGHAPPKSVIPIAGNRYLAFYHDHFEADGQPIVQPIQVVSKDGGLTWSKPERVGLHSAFPGARPCEPCLIRSSDGKQLLCLMRENSRQFPSLWMVSDDEGETWSDMAALPEGLTGDRHIARYTPDGRMVVTFRDRLQEGGTYGDFMMWVGTYEDVLEGREGDYQVRLLKNYGRPGDTGYAGLELLPDGAFVSTTYCVLAEGEQPLVVSVGFRMEEIDDRSHTL